MIDDYLAEPQVQKHEENVTTEDLDEEELIYPMEITHDTNSLLLLETNFDPPIDDHEKGKPPNE